MANLRDIRRRISGIRSTSKITQAMKLVAAAKLRRAQEAITAARPYAASLRGLMAHLMPRIDRTAMPLLAEREEVGNVLLVIVTADRGMCGPFNTNIIRLATKRIHETYKEKYEAGQVQLFCIGRRGYQHFIKRDYNVVAKQLGITASATLTDAQAIVDEILSGYMAGEYDKVEVIYNEFKSVVQQKLVVEDFLPLPSEPEPVIESHGHHFHEYVDYIYEPSERALMEYLVPKHLNFQLLRVLFESNASEQGARMTAMDAATTNARDLISSLQLQYNRARQEKITKELIEIVGGAEALEAA